MIISFSVIFMELGDGTVWWSHNISAAEKVKDDVCISGGARRGGAGRDSIATVAGAAQRPAHNSRLRLGPATTWPAAGL